MLVNRVGDFALALGILYIFTYLNVLDYATSFSLIHLIKNETINFLVFKINVINIICLLLFIGAMGKSAQIGLHT
jgi:NADH-quinone oxidoreductase subunit L